MNTTANRCTQEHDFFSTDCRAIPIPTEEKSNIVVLCQIQQIASIADRRREQAQTSGRDWVEENKCARSREACRYEGSMKINNGIKPPRLAVKDRAQIESANREGKQRITRKNLVVISKGGGMLRKTATRIEREKSCI